MPVHGAMSPATLISSDSQTEPIMSSARSLTPSMKLLAPSRVSSLASLRLKEKSMTTSSEALVELKKASGSAGKLCNTALSQSRSCLLSPASMRIYSTMLCLTSNSTCLRSEESTGSAQSKDQTSKK